MERRQDDNYGAINNPQMRGSHANPSKVEDEEKQPLTGPTEETSFMKSQPNGTQDVTVRQFDPDKNDTSNHWKSYIWKGVFIFILALLFIAVGVTYNANAQYAKRLEQRISVLSTNIKKESTGRKSDVIALSTNIKKESTGRKADIVALSTNINKESTGRKADVAALSTNVSRVVEKMKTNIDQESTDRKADIVALSTNIDKESTGRKAAIVALSTNVSRVVKNMKKTIDDESSGIKADLVALLTHAKRVVENIKSNISEESTVRKADIAALSTNVSRVVKDMEANIGQETTGRKAAIIALSTNVSRVVKDMKATVDRETTGVKADMEVLKHRGSLSYPEYKALYVGNGMGRNMLGQNASIHYKPAISLTTCIKWCRGFTKADSTINGVQYSSNSDCFCEKSWLTHDTFYKKILHFTLLKTTG